MNNNSIGLKRRKTLAFKPGNLLYAFEIFALWAISAWNTYNPDYNVYKRWFDLKNYGGILKRFEPGFAYSMIVMSKMNLSYQQFLMIYFAIGLIIIALSVKCYCRQPALVILLYGIYPFFMDIVQIRNFMAEAIIIFALRFLEERSKRNIFLYILFVMIASTFHITFMVFLIFLLAYFKNYFLTLKISLSITLCLGAFIIIDPGGIAKAASKFVATVYFEEEMSLYRVLGYAFFAVLIIVIVWLYYYRSKNGKQDNKEYNYLMYIIPTLLVMISFIALSAQCYRFFRNMLLISYIVLINIGIKRERHIIKFNNMQLIISLSVLFISVFFFEHQLGRNANHYETVTRAVLENNLLFDYLGQ